MFGGIGAIGHLVEYAVLHLRLEAVNNHLPYVAGDQQALQCTHRVEQDIIE